MLNITMNELGELVAGLLGVMKPDSTSNRSCSLKVGEKYLIRTVTFYYLGRLNSITDCDLVLENASWIPDTGRFSDCLVSGELNEIEPYPNTVIVNRGMISDCSVWKHTLPREKK
jgi:hypothetical protein